VLTTGSYSNVIRLLMPLVIMDAEFDEGLGVLEAAFESVATVSREREGVIA
jgi:4-aminobutyrate aminotransferase-like enzyme